MSKWILLSSLCVEKNLSQSVNLLNLSSKFLFNRRKPKYLTTLKEFTKKTVLLKILMSKINQKRLRRIIVFAVYLNQNFLISLNFLVLPCVISY